MSVNSLFNGEVTLLNAPPTYKPTYYPEALEAWEKQQKMHWLPEEVTMIDDIRDWSEKLTEAERHLLIQIFRFFTQADIEVNNCYMRHYLQVFSPTEVKMMLTSFSNMETIHVRAYAFLLQTLGIPEGEYQAFMKYKAMKDKYDYMQQFNVDSKFDIALTLGVFGAFTEGVQLFASFAMLLNFQRFGKMKGMGQIVAWSARDETLHTNSIIWLFHTFVQENPEIWTEKLHRALTDSCRTIVEHEDAFIDLAFEFDDAIQGMEASDIKQYIRFIADRRLNQLGLDPIYNVQSHPLPWMDEILNSPEFVNFFENRATDYVKSSTQGSWDEVFAEFDRKNSAAQNSNN